MRALGFDFGSVYVKGVLLDSDGRVSSTLYKKRGVDDFAAISQFLANIFAESPGEKFKTGITGFSRTGESDKDAVIVNPLQATVLGARRLGFDGSSILEAGGQHARFISIDSADQCSIREFAINDVCASGSGMFIEQQAGRLKMSLEEFSEQAASAPRAVAIAGRCAVFAKSDMIHMQQKGVEIPELARGLCNAISRNLLAMLLKGREIVPPVFIAGGCAANRGIIKAFKSNPALQGEGKLVVSPLPGMEAALGAAILAEKTRSEGVSLELAGEFLRQFVERNFCGGGALAPLQKKAGVNCIEPVEIISQPVSGFLGVDVGSVSTDLAVLGTDGQLLSAVYLPTRGRPVEVLREGLEIMRQRFPAGLKIAGCGTTGSGRHLAGKILGADIIKNEITCQFLGVQKFMPEVDTIFEIGGQDSKFISLQNGVVNDFLMNKVCAAGTGSFLEEQAAAMGIDIFTEFSQLAFLGKEPVDLGSQCTVFMETEIVGAMQQGKKVADICAGLAYAIVRNYLEKVVGNRPIGRKIAFQGGVASNSAVVAAFEQILQREVTVMPYNRISGAIGAAIAAERATAGRSSAFRGFDCSNDAVISTFRCHLCTNNCEVSMIEQNGVRTYYGDTCERYTSSGGLAASACAVPNLAADYLAGCEAFFPTDRVSEKRRIGIPRASTFMGLLPFWAVFFSELGFLPILSAATSTATVELGIRHLPASICLPAKLMAGHVAALAATGVDYIFLPSLMHLPGKDQEHSFACGYAMALPFMINLPQQERGRLISPVLSLTDESSFVEGFAGCLDELKVSGEDVRRAYRVAAARNEEFHGKMQALAADYVKSGNFRHVFSILGKPYNLLDPYLNLGLFERLRRMGILAVPINMLPVEHEDTVCCLPWGLSAAIFRAAAGGQRTAGFYPLVTSNFGCALDAFTARQLESQLASRPHLMVEFDEHRAEAGLITRLEAFIDQLENSSTNRSPRIVRPTQPDSPAVIPDLQDRVFMPYWSDYVFAYAGIWELHGYGVEILPMPDQKVRILGEKFSMGKECSPYSMIVGDLLRLHEENSDCRRVYHFPSVAFPCLLNQYGNSIISLMADLQIKNLRLSSLNGVELAQAFGMSSMQLLYEGLLAIDILVKAACEIRPYEKVPGMTSELHRLNLLKVREGIKQGNVVPALNAALESLASVPVDRRQSRPLIGVAGDLYTKVNEVANNNLFLWLESHGFEVWPSPSQIDLLDCGITSAFLQSLSTFELRKIIAAGTAAFRAMIGAWRIKSAAGSRVAHLQEPGYREMLDLARPYMHNGQYELLLVNIAKIVDYCKNGAAGVINAICLNCMVGNASAAIIEKIRKDHPEVPIVTAVFSGSENPGRQMLLDTFACQVRETAGRRARRQNGSDAAGMQLEKGA